MTYPFKKISHIKKTSQKLYFLLFCFVLSSDLFSARYDLTKIDEPVVNAINNIGTIVGTHIDGRPYVRRRDPTDMSYPEEVGVAEQERLFNIILPTDFDNSESAGPPVSNIDYLEIHVLDINNELEQGSGGSIVGWYIDTNNERQGVLWYQVENNRQTFEYVALTLPPHTLSPRYCTGNPEADFPNTECMLSLDSELIIRASLCPTNVDWTYPNLMLVDKTFDYTSNGTPDCSSENVIPICELKAEKRLADPPTKTIQGEDGGVTVPSYDYVLSKDYETQECILREHAEFVLQAMQCDNTNFNAAGDVINIECDKSSQAIGINNEGLIIGISNKPDNTNRPIVWQKSEDEDVDGNPIYKSADLGTERLTIKGEGSADTDSQESDKIEYNYRNGFPTSIDKTTNTVVGMLRLNGPDSILTPMYWTSVSSGGFDIPDPLLAPDPSTFINDACNPDTLAPEAFTNAVTPTSTSSGVVVGWYEDASANPKALMWRPCPFKNEDNVTINQLKSGHIKGFDDRNVGKALDNNVTVTVGTTKIDVVDVNGDQVSENHAFFRSGRCGLQDLNALLASPITDNSLLLESAYSIATGDENSILVQGKETESGFINSYVLSPTEIFTDLEVRIKSDHKILTVGDQHSINIIVSNNGAVDNDSTSNYATCIFFKLTASVYTQETYEDKIKQALADGIAITEELEKELENYPKIEDELVGGLTFDSYDQSNKEVVCVVTRIEIVCALERLNPGDAVSLTVKTTPRPLLADRTIRTSASVFSTESETPESMVNNVRFELIEVEREACFIATAAYGSYLAPEVKVLRDFRDNVLLKSTTGKHLVNFYYDVSPPLANYIAKNEVLRNITRWLLSPLIYAVAYPIISLFLLMLFIGFSIKYSSVKKLSKKTA